MVVIVVIIKISCEFMVCWKICVVLEKLLCIVGGMLSCVMVWLMVFVVCDNDVLVGRLKVIVDVVESFWWFIDSGVLVGCYWVK